MAKSLQGGAPYLADLIYTSWTTVCGEVVHEILQTNFYLEGAPAFRPFNNL
jgi:hypothetical protein